MVVIGAGVLGLSTALHAALLGRSVIVVDRATAGSQASGRAAGLFKSVQADELRTGLARRSIAKVLSFADWTGVPLEVTRSGSFLIARTDAHKAYLRRELDQSSGWGVDLREAAPGELAGRLPYYHGDGRELALWCPEDAYIEEPMSLVEAYLAAARRHGVEVAEDEAVLGVTMSGGRAAGVETTARTLEASAIVDAAGAWARQVAALAGGELALAPVRHQLLITEPEPGLDPAAPIGRVVDVALYLRPARGGLMAGVFEPTPLPLDPRAQAAAFSTDDVPLDLDVLRKVAGQVEAEVPLATAAPVAELRGGLYTMSPDGLFLAGRVPDVPGLWAASGCNGSGFSCSPAIGEALADRICGREDLLGIGALSPARFGALTDEALIDRGIWQYAHYYDPAA